MIAQFSLDRVNKSPAIFDQRKLEWLNLQYGLGAPQDELIETLRPLVVKHLIENGYLSEGEVGAARAWLDRITLAVFASKDKTWQLLHIAKLIFDYSGENAVRGDETRHVVEDAGARDVLRAFIPNVLAQSEFDYNRFREIAKAVQKETGKKGKDLFHPIRVALTGAASGPELEKLIPIFEAGSKLSLARHVKSCAERLREFAAAAGLL